MKKVLYRIRQYILSRFLHLTEHKTAHIEEGAGSVNRIPSLLENEGAKSVLLVTTPGTIRRGMLCEMQELAAKKGIAFTVFTEVPNDPDVASVEAGRAQYSENDCRAIVAVGGGSVLVCAKMIGARVARPRRTVA